LLARPDWLFLDESTSAVDEKLEADLYLRLAEQLPDATIVSMGHRSTLHPLHDRHMEMTLTDAGLFSPREGNRHVTVWLQQANKALRIVV
jgi:putative ATP-binding cassette transporter